MKVKVLSQHYSGFLMNIMKTFLKHKQGMHE